MNGYLSFYIVKFLSELANKGSRHDEQEGRLSFPPPI